MRKYILALFGLLAALLFLALFSFPDRNLHVIFCDVGQGDAILIMQGKTQMLVDGGPDKSVLSCLGSHMPFWDREIEAVLVTHPQDDHFGGIVDVVRRYNTHTLIHPGIDGPAKGWSALKDELKSRAIKETIVSAGDKIRFTNLYFDILSPPKSYRGNDPPVGGQDLNEYSIVGNLSYGEFDVLLTGDVLPRVIPLFIDEVREEEVLKVPHHGSKNGLTKELLEKSRPQLAVISVGKNNRFGHPHKEIMRLLGDKDIRVLRTDVDGEVELVSDGERWWRGN